MDAVSTRNSPAPPSFPQGCPATVWYPNVNTTARWQTGKLAPESGLIANQMLPVTWEITLTIATYQIQGQSEYSADPAKVEFLSSCLNNL